MASVRYLVRDVDQAVAFYTGHLGFELKQQFGPAMAILARGDLTLWLAGPMASASRPMPDGRKPEPGGWTDREDESWRPGKAPLSQQDCTMIQSRRKGRAALHGCRRGRIGLGAVSRRVPIRWRWGCSPSCPGWPSSSWRSGAGARK